MKELYKRYRPKNLSSVEGQGAALSSLQAMIDRDGIPHAILLSGPSGCGKTTVARILKRHLDCEDSDFFEINCADFKGIDMVRDIRRMVQLHPMGGSSRIWLIDEAHKLTGDAQNAFLKLLEDTPSHAYFLLATTDPQKLLRTVMTRVFEVKLSALAPAAIVRVLDRVIEREGLAIAEEVKDAIVEAAEGSARKALVILEQVAYLPNVEKLKAVLTSSLFKNEAIELARLLINPKGAWGDVAKVLKGLAAEDPEGIRWLVLGYARSVLLGGGPLADRSFKIIDIFSRPFYDSKHPGLAAACWEVVKR